MDDVFYMIVLLSISSLFLIQPPEKLDYVCEYEVGKDKDLILPLYVEKRDLYRCLTNNTITSNSTLNFSVNYDINSLHLYEYSENINTVFLDNNYKFIKKFYVYRRWDGRR